MAPQPNKPSNKHYSNNKAKGKKPPVYSPAQKKTSTLFESFNSLLDKHSKGLLIIILGISVLFSLLLFQARMDIGGDDSGYILRAYNFIHQGIFPSYQGPLYPLVLSIFVSFLGIKIIFLKFLSVIFNFIAMLFLYKAFKKRVPALVLFSVLLLTAVNASILNFASLTYNEAFFMALQYIFFYYFFKLEDSIQLNSTGTWKDTWSVWLPVAVLTFLITITRNIGVSCIAGLLIYFAFRKQYMHLLYVFILLLICGIYIKTQGSSQGNLLLLKNPYNPSEGKRDLTNFLHCFFQNGNLFISKRLFQILGFRADSEVDANSGLTFFTILFLFIAIYRSIKSKNYYLVSAALYVICMLGATSVALQIRWDQPTRMMMIYVPIILMLFFYGLYDICKKAPWLLQMLVVLIIPIIFLSEFSATIKKTKENIPILTKNLSGDIYYGFTPDWVNYLKLSHWCENLPKDSLVACRKGPMSSVYANGREFFNVAVVDSVRSSNADSVISLFKRNHVRYILLAKLRLNPLNPDQGFINTLYRLIAPVARKYPQKLKFIKQEGTSEEAQLYEVLY